MSNSINELSVWARNIAPSPTLAVDAKAKAMKAQGLDVCGFGAGEPDFDTPDFIKEACAEALRQGKTKYEPSSGIAPLREAWAAKLKEENGISNVTANDVIVSPGGKFSCYLAFLAVCSPGDEVLIPTPYWVSYPEMAKLAGATPKFIQAGPEQAFKITPQQIEEAITPRTRMLVLNSPSNPTGMIYTRAEIEAIAEVVVRRNLWLMSDEIYEYLLYDGVEHVSPASISPEVAARTITTGGFSKTYAMTGWRLGVLAAPSNVAKAIGDIQSQTTSNATSFAQYGALVALQQKDKARAALADMLKVFDSRRLKMWQKLNAVKGISCVRSEGAFYLFPDVSGTGLDSATFASRLLETEQVAVVPGHAFGEDKCIRLSYATSDTIIDKGLERIERFCNSL